jgi:hypothetical protein
MNIIFQINGGIGKCIVATAVCEAIKKKYPESNLIVISGYPNVFFNNPNVYKNFLFNETAYFYKEYVENKEVLFFVQDPYLQTDFIKANKHLAQIWCETFGLEYQGEYPKIYLTKREIDRYVQGIDTKKPILLMQTNGGADVNKRYAWARDIPSCVVKDVIEEFKPTHSIFHIKREEQLSYENTTPITTDLRQICAISLLSERRLVMDSFLQHCLGALGLPAVVCWIVNSPVVYGYELHTNILANPNTFEPDLKHSLYTKFDFLGNELEFPYNDEQEIFDSKEVIELLHNYNNKLN